MGTMKGSGYKEVHSEQGRRTVLATPTPYIGCGTPYDRERCTSERRRMMCSPRTPQLGQSKNAGKVWAWR